MKKLIYLYLLFSLYTLYKVLNFPQQVGPAEAIIVLGTKASPQGPSPLFKQRILTAINLYHKQLAPSLIFSGGKANDTTHSEALTAYYWALNQKSQFRNIKVEQTSTTTEENLKNCARLFPAQSVIIVTDPYHLPRAQFIAQQYYPKVYTKACTVDLSKAQRYVYLFSEVIKLQFSYLYSYFK